MEYLVQMDIEFAGLPAGEIERLLGEEAEFCRPYLESGEFARAWMTWGNHFGDHGHAALWSASSAKYVADQYAMFPLVKAGYTFNWTIITLNHNPNDPGPHPMRMAKAPIPLTYGSLRGFLNENGTPSGVTNEGVSATLLDGVTIHDHPHSGRPRELHFMVDGQKIAEIGPPTSGPGEEVAPAYIDLLAEWDGKPVRHDAWKNLILADNNLLFTDYESAKSAPRRRHQLAANPG